MYIEKIQTGLGFRRAALESFLEAHGLSYEQPDVAFGVYGEGDRLIGTGSRGGSVLKMFAVDAQHAGTGVMELLIQALLEDAAGAGLTQLFVYTKAGYAAMFGSFGFTLLASTGSTALLFRGRKSILEHLAELDIPQFTGVTGAVVINANPFTNGHKYLIEQALTQVDNLIIFLVSTDRSAFSYSDRLNMLRLGLGERENVIIRPSTDFLISAATFPSYFLKERTLIEREQALLDALVFKNYFVPAFGISVRFLGSEPLDESTAIYNEVLSDTLAGTVDVKIIERLSVGGQVVSASAVRRLLAAGDIEAIKPLVPGGVYEYLTGRDRHA